LTAQFNLGVSNAKPRSVTATYHGIIMGKLWENYGKYGWDIPSRSLPMKTKGHIELLSSVLLAREEEKRGMGKG
jgi:hypothetical protein